MSLTHFRSAIRRSSLIMIGTAILSVSACEDEAQFGNLTVNYQFGRSSGTTCEEADVSTIRMTLNDDMPFEATCDDTNAISASNVPAQVYSTVLEGINPDGIVVYHSTPELIEVPAGSSQEVDIRLELSPAQVQFTFVLLQDSGIPYGPNDTPAIRDFDVEITRNNCGIGLLDYTFEYAALTSVQDVPVPDPDGDIFGDDVDCIIVYANDQQGTRSQIPYIDGQDEVFNPPGPGRTISMRIDCEGTDCTLTRDVEGEEQVTRE